MKYGDGHLTVGGPAVKAQETASLMAPRWVFAQLLAGSVVRRPVCGSRESSGERGRRSSDGVGENSRGRVYEGGTAADVLCSIVL